MQKDIIPPSEENEYSHVSPGYKPSPKEWQQERVADEPLSQATSEGSTAGASSDVPSDLKEGTEKAGGVQDVSNSKNTVYKPADIFSRSFALLVDTIIAVGLGSIFYLFYARGSFDNISAIALSLLVVGVAATLYGYLTTTIFGGTFGMYLFRLRVLSVSNNRKAFLPNIARSVAYFIGVSLPLLVVVLSVYLTLFAFRTVEWDVLFGDFSLIISNPVAVMPSLEGFYTDLHQSLVGSQIVDIDSLLAQANLPSILNLDTAVNSIVTTINNEIVAAFANFAVAVAFGAVYLVLLFVSLLVSIPLVAFNLIASVFGDMRRSIHDIAAGTYVAKKTSQ